MIQTPVPVPTNQAALMEQVLVGGNLANLTPEQKVSHLKTVCESLGLNPLTRPFEYITLNGKLTLYAKRDATDQLRKINNVSVKIKNRELVDDIYVVTAEATMPNGRVDESIGAVPLSGIKGDGKANAIMKAETKAKRRVTLSICGLGFLDETEVETIAQSNHSAVQPPNQLKFPPKPDADEDVGDYIVPIGKKYKGKKLKEVPPAELFSFATWLKTQAREKNDRLQGFALELVEHIDVYLENLKVDAVEPSFEDAPFPFEDGGK